MKRTISHAGLDIMPLPDALRPMAVRGGVDGNPHEELAAQRRLVRDALYNLMSPVCDVVFDIGGHLPADEDRRQHPKRVSVNVLSSDAIMRERAAGREYDFTYDSSEQLYDRVAVDLRMGRRVGFVFVHSDYYVSDDVLCALTVLGPVLLATHDYASESGAYVATKDKAAIHVWVPARQGTGMEALGPGTHYKHLGDAEPRRWLALGHIRGTTGVCLAKVEAKWGPTLLVRLEQPAAGQCLYPADQVRRPGRRWQYIMELGGAVVRLNTGEGLLYMVEEGSELQVGVLSDAAAVYSTALTLREARHDPARWSERILGRLRVLESTAPTRGSQMHRMRSKAVLAFAIVMASNDEPEGLRRAYLQLLPPLGWRERMWRAARGLGMECVERSRGAVVPRIAYGAAYAHTLGDMQGVPHETARTGLMEPRHGLRVLRENRGVTIVASVFGPVEGTASVIQPTRENLAAAVVTRVIADHPAGDAQCITDAFTAYAEHCIVPAIERAREFERAGFEHVPVSAEAATSGYPAAMRAALRAAYAEVIVDSGDPVELRTTPTFLLSRLKAMPKVEAACAGKSRHIAIFSLASRVLQARYIQPIEHSMVEWRDAVCSRTGSAGRYALLPVDDTGTLLCNEAATWWEHPMAMVKGLRPYEVGDYFSAAIGATFGTNDVQDAMVFEVDFSNFDHSHNEVWRRELGRLAWRGWWDDPRDAEAVTAMFAATANWRIDADLGLSYSRRGCEMSGAADTSLGNGTVNRVAVMYAMWRLLCEVVPDERYASVFPEVVYLVEGDDGLGAMLPGFLTRTGLDRDGFATAFARVMLQQLGLSVKFRWIERDDTVEFCGRTIVSLPFVARASRTGDPRQGTPGLCATSPLDLKAVCGCWAGVSGLCHLHPPGGRVDSRYFTVRFVRQRLSYVAELGDPTGGVYPGDFAPAEVEVTGPGWVEPGKWCRSPVEGRPWVLELSSGNWSTMGPLELRNQSGVVLFAWHVGSASVPVPAYSDALRGQRLEHLVDGMTMVYASVPSLTRVLQKFTTTVARVAMCKTHRDRTEPSCRTCMRSYLEAALLLRARAVCSLCSGDYLWPLQYLSLRIVMVTNALVERLVARNRGGVATMLSDVEGSRKLRAAGISKEDILTPVPQEDLAKYRVSWRGSNAEVLRQGFETADLVGWADQLVDYLLVSGPPPAPLPHPAAKQYEGGPVVTLPEGVLYDHPLAWWDRYWPAGKGKLEAPKALLAAQPPATEEPVMAPPAALADDAWEAARDVSTARADVPLSATVVAVAAVEAADARAQVAMRPIIRPARAAAEGPGGAPGRGGRGPWRVVGGRGGRR
jgi:hypothetical protein